MSLLGEVHTVYSYTTYRSPGGHMLGLTTRIRGSKQCLIATFYSESNVNEANRCLPWYKYIWSVEATFPSPKATSQCALNVLIGVINCTLAHPSADI